MNDERLLAIISRLEGDIRNLEQAVAKAAEASIKQSQQVKTLQAGQQFLAGQFRRRDGAIYPAPAPVRERDGGE